MSLIENLMIQAIYNHTEKAIMENEQTKESVKTAQKVALNSIKKRAAAYYRDGFLFRLVIGVMEKELIGWSMASLEAPLNDDGARRYEMVFSRLFPEEAKQIWK